MPTLAAIMKLFDGLASVGADVRTFILEQTDVLVDVNHHVAVGASVGVVILIEIDGAASDGFMLGLLVSFAQGGVLVEVARVMAIKHLVKAAAVVKHDADEPTQA